MIKIEGWITPMEYSRHIGKSMTWVTKLMKSGRLPYIRYSSGRLVHKSGKILPEYFKHDKDED